MKVLYIIPLFLLLLLSCHDEDTIKAELQAGKYVITDDPNDPVQHFIYNFYQKYGVVILTNPDSSDYVYNFDKPNLIRVTPPKQDKQLLETGLQYLSEVFFDIYDDSFKKSYFPFTVQMADQISGFVIDWYEPQNIYANTGLIVVANINEELSSLDEETKHINRGEINAALWCNHLLPREAWRVRSAFYEPSKDYYDEFAFDSYTVEEGIIEAREAGFISFDPNSDTEDPEDCFLYIPSKETDVLLFIQFIFSSTQEEVEELMEEYPIIEEKYKILQASIKEYMNIDIFMFCIPS